ncbi:hypothetical protein RUM43_003523 [Polyplax serrata]|uniref:Uncharacterized protein n=1 Tax=Polyplax serrata TaxID=468196 RepID=A0AAN8S389_POLSC
MAVKSDNTTSKTDADREANRPARRGESKRSPGSSKQTSAVAAAAAAEPPPPARSPAPPCATCFAYGDSCRGSGASACRASPTRPTPLAKRRSLVEGGHNCYDPAILSPFMPLAQYH